MSNINTVKLSELNLHSTLNKKGTNNKPKLILVTPKKVADSSLVSNNSGIKNHTSQLDDDPIQDYQLSLPGQVMQNHEMHDAYLYPRISMSSLDIFSPGYEESRAPMRATSVPPPRTVNRSQ
jgi:hypothetical protein